MTTSRRLAEYQQFLLDAHEEFVLLGILTPEDARRSLDSSGVPVPIELHELSARRAEARAKPLAREDEDRIMDTTMVR